MSRLSSFRSARSFKVGGEINASGKGSLGDQNLQRLLSRLGGEGAAGVTVAELLASGVTAPAQSIYALQVAGYDIDRIQRAHPGGPPVIAYHLRANGQPAQSPG